VFKSADILIYILLIIIYSLRKTPMKYIRLIHIVCVIFVLFFVKRKEVFHVIYLSQSSTSINLNNTNIKLRDEELGDWEGTHVSGSCIVTRLNGSL
jgi:uncharacterized membrane protein